MKILRQDWSILQGGQITSISKDRAQLDATIEELSPKQDPEDESEILNYEKAAEPDGNAEELEIPDDSVFADMVRDNTVFLHDDEMDLMWENSSIED